MDRASVRLLADDVELNNCLYLIKNGIPFDVAFSLSPHEAMAYVIIFGRIDGGTWCWETMSWKKDS